MDASTPEDSTPKGDADLGRPAPGGPTDGAVGWQADSGMTAPVSAETARGGPGWSTGMADAGTGPIPLPGLPASGRRDWPVGDDPASSTAPQSVRPVWAPPPSRPFPPGSGQLPPPMAAGPGVAGPRRSPPFGGPVPQGLWQRPAGRQAPPGASPQRPLRQGERNAAVMAFVLHQFPIGYMPVAASHASRQLPRPETGDVVRCDPVDHPQGSLIDDTDALARVRSGAARPLGHGEVVAVPDELVAGHEPFGELSELEWEHVYAGVEGGRTEYVWPPAEMFPEGGLESGEPVVLEPDTVLDRIGDDSGRILAPEGALFAQRSLPPAYRERGFRRYRVMRRLPVWQAVSAPWFGQPGGAVRYRATHAVADLVGLGYLAELTSDRAATETPTLRLRSSTGRDSNEQ